MSTTKFEHIHCRLDQGIVVIALVDSQLNGDEIAETLRKEMLSAADAFSAQKWIIDFGRVQFFTSSGIRPLLTLHRKLQSVGARLVLCNLRSDIAEVFHATRLLATVGTPPGPFEAMPTLDDALRGLRHYSSQVQGNVLVLRIREREMRGEALAEEFGRDWIETWNDHQVGTVVIDFSEVEMITTPSIRSLIQLRNHVKEKGGEVALCDLAPQVAEVFTLTRLITPAATGAGLFASYPNTSTALATLNRG